MATKAEQQVMRVRRGYWITRARKRKGMTLQAVASLLGYSDHSESVISRWEDGTRPVPSDKLEPLARLLDLPASYLIRPPLTDDERLDAAVRAAEEFEREDWEGEGEARPKADDAPPGAPRIRAA